MKQHRPDPSAPAEPERAGTAQPTAPSPRERTRRRMIALAPLAVIAAAPVTNTACDPAPEPYCSETPRDTQLESLYADAAWQEQAGTLSVLLELNVSGAYPLDLGETFSVFGGTLEQTDAQGTAVSLQIAPDQGTTQIRVVGSLVCLGTSAAFTVIVDLTTPAEAGAAIPTTIE